MRCRGVRPDDLAATALKVPPRPSPIARPGRDRGGVLRRRATAPARTTATWRGWRCCSPAFRVDPRRHGQPAVRLGLEAVIDASASLRRRRRRLMHRRRRRVDDRRAVGAAKPSRAFPTTHEQVWNSTTLGWRMVNPRMPAAWTVALGEGAEILADEYWISRDEQDAFALALARTGGQGVGRGRVRGRGRRGARRRARPRRVHPRRQLARVARRSSSPRFREGGTVTAGNSSPMNDGSGACCWRRRPAPSGRARADGTRRAAREWSRPAPFGIGPVTRLAALQRADLKWDDLASVELNEAFAAQSLACLRGWPDLDPARSTPTAARSRSDIRSDASGARILTTLVHHLRRTAAATGSRRCASASARASRWSSRTCAARRAAQ